MPLKPVRSCPPRMKHKRAKRINFGRGPHCVQKNTLIGSDPPLNSVSSGPDPNPNQNPNPDPNPIRNPIPNPNPIPSGSYCAVCNACIVCTAFKERNVVLLSPSVTPNATPEKVMLGQAAAQTLVREMVQIVKHMGGPRLWRPRRCSR